MQIEDITLESSDESASQLSLFLNLEGYEGPIDMLLSLAREQKVDLTRIAILPLAEQYLEFIESAQTLDLEIAADYLVMAAWLAYLKSRLLLPEPDPEVASEVIDMTDTLRFQLLRLEAMQTASKRLMQLPKLHKSRLVRGMPEQFLMSDKVTFTANLYDLLKAYADIRSAENETKLTVIATKLFSVQEAAIRLRELIPCMPEWAELESFLPNISKKAPQYSSAVAAHFGAALELVKEGYANIKQETKFSPILLRSTREQND